MTLHEYPTHLAVTKKETKVVEAMVVVTSSTQDLSSRSKIRLRKVLLLIPLPFGYPLLSLTGLSSRASREQERATDLSFLKTQVTQLSLLREVFI